MKTLILALFLTLNAVASEQMIFLIEDSSGKHIGVSSDMQSYQRLSKGDLWHLYPTLSKDGTKMAYLSGEDEKSLTVVLKDMNSQSTQSLTKKGFVLHPSFARNGKMLFFSQKIGLFQKLVYVELETLTRGSGPIFKTVNEKFNAYFPTPFQSGEMIIYQRNLPLKKEIVMKNLLDDTELVIDEGMSPALSMDERYIAYTKKTDENWDIMIYDRIEKTSLKVTSNMARDFSPNFDRQNNLLYTSDRLENNVFSIFKQDFTSWKNSSEIEKLLITKPGVSFYAPKMTGLQNYKTYLMNNLSGTARSSFGTTQYKNKIYVVGGHQGAEHTYPPESFTGRMTVYDTKQNVWSNLAPRIHPSHGFQVVAFDDYLYAFGGFAYEESTLPKWKSLDVVERYNIRTNTWEVLKNSMPRKRSSNIVALIGHKVYVMGGWDATPKFDNDIDGIFHDDIDVFDLKAQTWSTLKTKLPKKRRAFNSFVKGDKIYLVGGISEGGSHFALLDDFTVYDTKSETFHELAKLPFATFAPASGTIGNEAYIFGGMFKTGKWDYEYVPHIYKYDFTAKSWSHTGRYLNEYKGFSQVVEFGGCLGILGGHSYQGNLDKPVDTFEKLCLR